MSAEFSNLAERIRILLSSRGVYTWQLNGECIYGLPLVAVSSVVLAQ